MKSNTRPYQKNEGHIFSEAYKSYGTRGNELIRCRFRMDRIKSVNQPHSR